MELFAPPYGLLCLPHHRCPFTASSPLLLTIPRKSLLASRSPISNPGLGRSGARPLRAMVSGEETSAAVVADDAAAKPLEGPSSFTNSSSPGEENPDGGGEAIAEAVDDLLSKLNDQVDSTILFYGAVALVALWISSTIISVIDSIPVFPKVLEVVGLGYTVWFSSRYLIFKETRDDFFSKLDDLKEKILGRSDD
uniref:Cyanobacterial aminoacyl-tRNA synthetase CAAD domain-containing protein n=1 Tax=Musa acuminata subsp. malaccensis TaxID=214687 RepID=A0A804JD32_MUSAM